MFEITINNCAYKIYIYKDRLLINYYQDKVNHFILNILMKLLIVIVIMLKNSIQVIKYEKKKMLLKNYKKKRF